MSYGNSRSYNNDLAYGEEPGPTRWDRDRFERASRRGPEERESFKFEEHDRYGPRGRRDVDIDVDIHEHRRAAPRVAERERFEEDRFERGPRRQPEIVVQERREVAERALAPYRRTSVVDRGIDVQVRRPARPQFVRRQSSLDTFDRRPLPRYVDEYRPPVAVLPRKRSPSRRRFREDDFEEIRYRDISPDERGRDYRDIRIKRERSVRRRRSKSSSSSFESVSPPRVEKVGKRGKTRMPKRLVHKSAIIQIGYPFEEEEDFLIVQRALGKDQIDEVIKISEAYKREDSKVVYKYEEKQIEAPPMLPLAFVPPPASVHESIHEHIHESYPLPPEPYYPPPMSVRGHSPPRREREERIERIEESNQIGGPLTIVLPHRRGREERDIKAEIRALEAEKRALRLERDAEEKRHQAERIRESEYEIIEKKEKEKDVVRVEKDRRGKRPNSKLVAAMLTTLT